MPAARCARLPLTEERGFLPDLDAITDGAVGSRASLLWLNYPNNPTGAVAPLVVPRTTRPSGAGPHDVLLASDEAYSELWFGERAARRRAAAVRPHERARAQHAVASARR